MIRFSELQGRLRRFVALRVSEAESAQQRALRALFERASDGFALLDGAGSLIAVNAALRRLAGPTALPRAGVPAAALFPVPVRSQIAGRIDSLLAGLPAEALETVLLNPQAPPDACCAVTLEALPSGCGAPLLLRVEDLTERRRMQAQLGRSRQLQTVGQLAGGIAHDFNNLLTAVVGSAEAALAREPDGTDSAADLRQILDSAARGAGLVRQLLAFARQQALQPRAVAVNGHVAAIAGLLRRLLGERVRLELALEEPGRAVLVDPTQLDQVIVNLAVNARDAMLEGGELRIATGHAVILAPQRSGNETVPPGRYVVLSVRDTGHGIPPELLPRLFEPFFTTKRDSGGTGLGLSTVHGIVRQSGGYLAVESAPGEGTCFSIYLPRHDGAAEPVAMPAPEPEPVAAACPPASEGNGRTVLLVDDEAPVRRLAERALRGRGWEVVTADCGDAALELLADGMPPPDALVSDVVMPGTDGLELARALRRRFPLLPVILVSGYAENTLGQDLRREGLHLLGKPYSPRDLCDQLARNAPHGHLARNAAERVSVL